MSFNEIFDLTAGVHFLFYNKCRPRVVVCVAREINNVFDFVATAE